MLNSQAKNKKERERVWTIEEWSLEIDSWFICWHSMAEAFLCSFLFRNKYCMFICSQRKMYKWIKFIWLGYQKFDVKIDFQTFIVTFFNTLPSIHLIFYSDTIFHLLEFEKACNIVNHNTPSSWILLSTICGPL